MATAYLDLVGHEGGRVGYDEVGLLPVAHLLLAPRLPRDVAPPRHQVVEPGPVVLDLRHFLEDIRGSLPFLSDERRDKATRCLYFTAN